MACLSLSIGEGVRGSGDGWGRSGVVLVGTGSVEVRQVACLCNLLSLISLRQARTWSTKSCVRSGPPAVWSSLWGLSWGLSKVVFQRGEPLWEWGLSSWVVDVIIWLFCWEGPPSDINNLCAFSLVVSPVSSETCRLAIKENLLLPNFNNRPIFVALSNVKVVSFLCNSVLRLAMY